VGKPSDVSRADRGFVLRTPLLPLETFASWQSASDSRAFLRDLVARPEVSEALFVATPSLSESIEKWRKEPDSPSGQQVELSLSRYVARMVGRCTPFGLFSAVSPGQLGSETSLQLAPRAEYRRRTRIDNDYIFALLDELVRQPAVRVRVRFRPNSSLYAIGGRLRYAEARLVGQDRSYHLVSVDPTPYLSATLERARSGAFLADLATCLTVDDAEVTLEEATTYVDELVAAQVIVPELGITVTGPEPIDAVVSQLAAAGITDPARLLQQARDALATIDSLGVGNDSAAYIAVAAELEQLPAKVELSRLFQVDMVKPAHAVLGTKVAADVMRIVEWLRSIQRAPTQTTLDDFRSAFSERYESRAVPLVEVLDEEAGIGFETAGGPGSEGSPLLAGLRFGGRPGAEQVPWTKLDRHMQRRLAAAIAAGADEIVLDENDRKAMAQDQAPPLPDAFHAQIRLRRSGAAEPHILLENAGGPSGARMLGRFCHASTELDLMVRAHLRGEEAHRPDAIFAEVVHLNEGRIGNIVCRPVLRDHEIVFLGVSGAPAERQIPADDLLVAVRGGRIVLLSRKHGREVIPRLTTAHNFRLRSLGIYRFLCALQASSGVQWSWGTHSRAPYLPRVRIGNVVVSRATWNVSAAQLEPITKIVREMANKKSHALPVSERRARIATAVADLRRALRLPRFLVIADSDNELPIDLDNAALVQVFADELSGRDGVELTEQFPEPDASPVSGPEGSYANQLTLMFGRPPSATTAATVTPATPAPTRTRRSFPPGSSWLYAKIYTGTSSVDRLLRDAIAPLARSVVESGDVKHWFFIRYADPHHHLRLRFHGEPTRLAGSVLPALERTLDPLREDGTIWKVQLDTYDREIERYGGDLGIELAEKLFWIDSEAVLGIVELLEGDAGADARWRLALRGSETLLDALGFDPDARHRIFAEARDSFGREHGVGAEFYAPIGERFKRERAALEELFAPDATRDAAHDLSPGFELLARRDERLRPLAAELRARDAAGELAPSLRELAWSYVHMHINRLLHASHRAQELVLYDLLRRLHEGRRARAKRG
jgi:lantibiotic biosynthesis protein